LLTAFSFEITPKEHGRLRPLPELVEPGTSVYITYLPRTRWSETLAVARQVAAEGMNPVPHLAARAVPDRARLRSMVGDLAAVGVREVLLVAGSLAAPAGEFHDTMQVLETGVLEDAGITRVGVAGHPEGTPDIDDAALADALSRKNALAAEHGLDLRIVTQFCFAAEPIVAWERRIRAAGNTLPVHVGLPGLTSPAKLLRFGLSCGVGASLKVLRKQAGGVLKLATTPVYHPDETLLGLARAIEADPASLLRAAHFFPFGAVEATTAWADGIRRGRFVVDDRDRLSVTA
jgi:methylenetetrahydrofolate reductase (NADPH)